MNVVVIEDERLTADRLIALIKQYDATIKVLARLSSVAESLAWFNATPPPVDLVFMDIHLEDGDSFQLISQLPLTTPIIFTTAFDDYMLKAFKVNSVDYLLKPIHYDDLAAALDKFRQLRSSQSTPAADLRALMAQLQRETAKYKERFMVTVGTRIRSVPTDDIAYFYLAEKAVLLVTHDGTTLPVDYSLDKLVQVLDPAQFFRISRQCLVSLRAIQVVHTVGGKLRLDLLPKAKQEVVVSGDRAADFKTWLGKD
ncbi:MAG: LytTR family DNA-binding domain-containing protein [Cyclobacteriaceae bacterium]